MQNLLSLWSALDSRRRVIIIGATLAMFIAVLAMSRLANNPSLALLYAGLDGRSAGEIVAILDQKAITYEVRGDSIYVETSQRDSLRMTLAAEGLPATGAAGYELLDGLSGFGTTSQMFDAAYWRAKEGELARTILANPQVRAARVHIAQQPTQAFRRDQPATASVTVTTASGSLTPLQARAIKHLVAAAVTAMKPEDVSVIDSVGGLITDSEDGAVPDANGTDRTAALRQNVERLLAARVGTGKSVVEVSLDVQTEREQITERTFDPQGRVAISSNTEERTSSATEPAGDVTVASNLPNGNATAGDSGKSQSSETREQVNYEVSETQRELLRSPGAIRKLSVAVLVDGLYTTATDGTVTWQPRTDEELAVLRELVASAVGLDEARGDVLTLKSLQFEPVVAGGTVAEAGMFATLGPVDILGVIQIAVVAMVALILGLFVIRPVLANAGRAALPPTQATLALPGNRDQVDASRVLTGEIDDGPDLPTMPVISPQAGQDDPMTRLRRLIDERQAESVEILRGWMETEEEKA